ncbi:hypothetical protein E8E11_000901 [Didymella keratinophila]|nr:hypothetical protein E8E11_000901 [Didymella keratinophila]
MSATQAGPPRSAEYLAANKGPQTLVSCIVFPALAGFIVALRLYTRVRIVRSPSHEDFAIVLAMMFSIGNAVCQVVQVYNGMGRHKEAVTFNQVVTSLKALYASIIFYNFGLTLTKISILLQYLRIATEKPIRQFCWISIWFTVAVSIETLVAGILQCMPIARFWDARIPGKCINTVALYYANAAINVVQDVSLVVLPFFMLRSLIMPRKEKMTLMIILGLGGVATIASIFRLHALYVLTHTTDITWDNPGTAIWSAIELNVGILCASLPTLRAFFIRIWPKTFLSSYHSRRTNLDTGNGTKGQYYNMEGSIMVKKTVADGKWGDGKDSCHCCGCYSADEDYHVAWICLVADLELLPARLMLDEEHDTPQYDTHFDDNTYVFGSIKGHTVVIGTLPPGETANVNAARLSGLLFRTFPSIRMALLVGIGGGIPSATISSDSLENVHLGDVVVGWPGDGKPACIYHERGRSKTDGFEIVGTVQNPEWRLITALGVLRTDHELEKTSFNDQLARLHSVRKLKKRFTHPGVEHDKLFKTAYPHEGEEKSGCTNCQPSELVRRPQRTEEDRDTFVIHFGRIASGNSVVKDAVVRDEIRSRCDGALCVEMEAAGVDANRRCLVIRGISDYADSHKCDMWRSYAAGKAAAFARELLCRVQPGVVKDMNTQTQTQTQETEQAAWLVPLPRPPSYVGREAQLSRLKTHISSTDSCRLAVYGLGGCGKTALALETAYHLRETHPETAVFWIPAISQSSFQQAFRQIGEQLRIPNITDSKSDAKQLVKAKLSDESVGPWLLVVDNADDLDILYRSLDEGGSGNRLIDYLPHNRNGSIIFTTRTKQVAVDLAETNVVELGKLDEQEAKHLLKTRLLPPARPQLESEAVVGELLDTLAFFALAIVQAVAFINKTDSSLADYVRLYKANEQAAVQLLSKEFEDQGRYRETKNPIATTWYITFEQIRKHDKFAVDYLSFMACTNNTNIPASMLPESDSEMNHMEALGILKAYGFITRRQSQPGEEDEHEAHEDQTEAFDMHPLVHLATRV